MREFTRGERERFRRSPAWGDGVFANLLPTSVEGGLSPEVLRKFVFEGKRRTPPGPLPSVPVDRAVLGGPAAEGWRVTWLGHSTSLVEVGGRRVLLDPVWSQRASPVSWAGPRRFQPVPVAIAQLPALDAVLVSHDHYDHLDHQAVVELSRRGAPIVTALGVGARLEAWGVPAARITELDWWQEHTVAAGLTIRAMPARHFSGRGLGDRNRTLWAAWSLEAGGQRVFFGGDGGMDEANFAAIGERVGPFDLTMLEIGAFDPAWEAIHLGPANAVRAHALLGGKVLLPVHWGTFDLALHSWDAPGEELLAIAAETGVQVALPRLGESVAAGRPLPGGPWWRGAGGPPPPPPSLRSGGEEKVTTSA